MVFRNFRVNVVIRLLLIFGILCLMAYYLTGGNLVRPVYLGIGVIILCLELFYYIDRTNRAMAQFLESIHNEDFSSKYKPGKLGRSFSDLFRRMNEVNEKYQASGKEQEARRQYLASLMDQVQVGLLSYDHSARVHFVNRAFRTLLDAKKVKNGTDLRSALPEFFTIIQDLSPGKPEIIRFTLKGEDVPFSVQARGFRTEQKQYTIVSVQDIRTEINETELEAWQKIIRILTHEIMNSVTPITSLSGSLFSLLQHDREPPGRELRQKLVDGLEAIIERSGGLIKFTEAYQDLARLPAPVIRKVRIADLLQRMEVLFSREMEQKKINFHIAWEGIPEQLNADPDLLEQVLINLLRNAAEATVGMNDPEIIIEISSMETGQVHIAVRDNGKGITREDLSKVFVPFYTTKRSGSGIGLSLSRQVMIMHKGSVEVRSEPGKGSVFTLVLPQ